MSCNVGGLDRVLRIVAGLVILALGIVGPLGWWGLVGLVPLATGALRFCPAYTLLGIRTCPAEGKAA
jgi:hypothetical protein